MENDSGVTTLIFDWGDTLMKVLPDFDGPMAEWPVVETVDGAAETLAALKNRYHMVVATNAAASSATQVLAALGRAQLGQYIASVYTFHELGSRKPDPAFFHALAEAENEPARWMVMVGDEYAADITGAWQAGLRTIWLNSDHKPAPGLFPIQTAEIGSLVELPAALLRLDLPGVETCLAWLLREGAPAGLLQHVQAVAAAAYQMALWLQSNGVEVDPLLAHRGGLLHDLAKLSPVIGGTAPVDHAERAAQMLLARKQPALAEIADRHLLPRLLDPLRAPTTWEQKLVYFIDKLVENGQIVNVQERLAALQQRYPAHSKEIAAAAPAVLALQDELCQRAGFPPQELTARLRQAMRG